MLPLLVNIRFQDLLIPLSGFFSPFPHGTSSLSVVQEYLALEDGPPRFPQGYSSPVVLRYRPMGRILSPTRLSRSLAGFSKPFD